MKLQSFLVGIIVVAAVLFAIWRLPGDATRLRYTTWLKRMAGARGPLHWLALRLEARVARAAAASGCANCSSAGEHRPSVSDSRQRR